MISKTTLYQLDLSHFRHFRRYTRNQGAKSCSYTLSIGERALRFRRCCLQCCFSLCAWKDKAQLHKFKHFAILTVIAERNRHDWLRRVLLSYVGLSFRMLCDIFTAIKSDKNKSSWRRTIIFIFVKAGRFFVLYWLKPTRVNCYKRKSLRDESKEHTLSAYCLMYSMAFASIVRAFLPSKLRKQMRKAGTRNTCRGRGIGSRASTAIPSLLISTSTLLL